MGLISRFFRIPKSHIAGNKASIVPTNDVLPLDVLTDAKTIYEVGDGTVLIHALLKQHNVAAMIDGAEIANPLSVAGAEALGLSGIYVGMDYSDTPDVGLFWFLPELKGPKMVPETMIDEDGVEVETGNMLEININIPRHFWGNKED